MSDHAIGVLHCRRCGVAKPLDQFYVRKQILANGTPQRTTRCRDCDNAYARDHRARDPEKARARGRRCRLAHRDRYAPTEAASHRRWVKANPERALLIKRAALLVRRAVEWGFLAKSDRCGRCDTTNVQLEASHADYSKVLDVEWLCRPCHRQWDSAEPKTLWFLYSQQEVAA